MVKLFRRTFGVLIVLAVFFSFYQPAISHAGLISTKEEISIGRDVAQRLEKKHGLVDDEVLQQRVASIGAKLVAVCDRKDLPWTFKVLNVKEINAISLPGGPVYLYKGLVDYMPSDEELAGVLAHEVGHIVKKHSVKQMEKSLGMSLLFGAVFGDRGVLLQNLAYNAILAGYSRSDEREADLLGFTYCLKAGYNPYSLLMGMKKLGELENTPRYGLFSDHPDPESRVKLLNSYAEANHIRPTVEEVDKTAKVVDGNWSFPLITTSYNNYKPKYRAYFLAGTLYQISCLPDLNGDKFILFEDEDKVNIYYDDWLIHTVTKDDTGVDSIPMDLAQECVLSLKSWVNMRTAGK